MYLQTVKIIISYEGGERVNHAILMSSGAENIDFMIHGIVQYEIFGHKVWITTSHVCILIVMLLMMALAIAGNRAIKHAKEIPGGFQNVIELMVEMLDNMALHWEKYFQHIREKYNSIYKVQMPPITPHVCRHTFCSNMAKSGMNPKMLQYIMGHSDISVTMNTYTHVKFQDAQEDFQKAINS